jgi:hypothetical protein
MVQMRYKVSRIKARSPNPKDDEFVLQIEENIEEFIKQARNDYKNLVKTVANTVWPISENRDVYDAGRDLQSTAAHLDAFIETWIHKLYDWIKDSDNEEEIGIYDWIIHIPPILEDVVDEVNDVTMHGEPPKPLEDLLRELFELGGYIW